MKPLPSRLTFYMSAFDDLVNDRQYFMGGVSAMSFEAIDRWARRHGVAGDQFERLVRMVRALDRVWLEDYGRKAREASKTK